MYSYPFVSKVTSDNPYGDRAITDAMERAFNRACWSNGVCAGEDLFVQAGDGMNVAVSPGACIINGAKGVEETTRRLPISASNASLSRIDRIVARFDLSDAVRSIELYVKEGTPSTTPVGTNLVQADNYCEICLGEVTVAAGVSSISQADIKDTRADEDICGFVSAASPAVLPAKQYLEQLRDMIDSNLQLLQSAIDDTTAGRLNTKVTQLEQLQSEASTRLDGLDSDITSQKETIEALRTELGDEIFADNTVLWTGTAHMGNGQTISFSDSVQNQKTGIVLIWSHFNKTVDNSGFNIFFIPKWQVNAFSSGGVENMCSDFGTATRKYVYVRNDGITGNSVNTSGNGQYQVLRAVIGV